MSPLLTNFKTQSAVRRDSQLGFSSWRCGEGVLRVLGALRSINSSSSSRESSSSSRSRSAGVTKERQDQQQQQEQQQKKKHKQ